MDKPTWGRFPWELDSDLYKKWALQIREWLVAKITTVTSDWSFGGRNYAVFKLRKEAVLMHRSALLQTAGWYRLPCVSDLQNFGSLQCQSKVRAPQNNHETFISVEKKATGLLIFVHVVDTFKTHLKGCKFLPSTSETMVTKDDTKQNLESIGFFPCNWFDGLIQGQRFVQKVHPLKTNTLTPGKGDSYWKASFFTVQPFVFEDVFLKVPSTKRQKAATGRLPLECRFGRHYDLGRWSQRESFPCEV